MAIKKHTKSYLLLLPLFGIIIFATLYLIATLNYPGGSQSNKSTPGFSWMNNYWCDLLNDVSINGVINDAQPIAMCAMVVLCLSLSCFWWVFPNYVSANKLNRMIKMAGPLSMLSALLLFTQMNHDFSLGIATFFGILAVAGTIIGLFTLKWKRLFVFGLLNILLVGLNNYVYYNKTYLHFLPVIQKISFASFLIWIFCIDFVLYLKLKEKVPPPGIEPGP